MKNKRLFVILTSWILCLCLVMTICTGCIYELGKNIGNQLKAKITADSDSVSHEIDTTSGISETTESISPTSSTSTTESSSTANDNSTTKQSSTTDSADNNQSGNGSKNEIQVSLDMDYIFNISGDVSKINFIVIIPKEYKDRQRIINTQYSTKPERIFDDGPDT